MPSLMIQQFIWKCVNFTGYVVVCPVGIVRLTIQIVCCVSVLHSHTKENNIIIQR